MKVLPTPDRKFLPELPLCPVSQMGLTELERIRLILRGGSVIEWRRMHFRGRDEVDRFFRLCDLNPDDPVDEAWVRTVLADAVEYLRRTFSYRVAEAVANPKEIHDLFLFASGIKEPKRYRKIACVVLKVMHVIQHIEGRDLLFHISVSEAELSQLVTEKVLAVANQMLRGGLPVVSFTDSIKTRESIITKLIAKRESVAAQIYDRTRFRIITKKPSDVLPVVYHLTQHLFPFVFLVPAQTENSLISFREVLDENPGLAKLAKELHLDPDYESRHKTSTTNRFSARGYRILNFVVNIPVRLDSYLPPPEQDYRQRKGRIAFGLAEFQICDRETAEANDRGENSHARYKERQKKQVLHRLARGLVVPRTRQVRK